MADLVRSEADKYRRRWRIFYGLMLLFGGGALAITVFAPVFFGGLETAIVPISLRPNRFADYSEDPNTFRVPAMRQEMLIELLDSDGPGLDEELPTLVAFLSTPVPQVTPVAGPSATEIINTLEPSPLPPTDPPPRATALPETPTLSPTPRPSVTAAVTPTATVLFTPTPTPGETLQPSPTVPPPTATESPSPSPTPPEAPTATSPPPSPTATLPPPSPTATVEATPTPEATLIQNE